MINPLLEAIKLSLEAINPLLEAIKLHI